MTAVIAPLIALALALGLWAIAIVYVLRSARREVRMRLRQARATGRHEFRSRRDPRIRFPH